jgi:alkylhydroperoxidase family enzyme
VTPEPRLSEATALDDAQRELLAAMRTDDQGRPLNLFSVLVHYPLLLDRVAALGRVFLREGTLPARERELVILRVAWRVRSRYEFAQHARLGRQIGLSDEEIERVAQEGLDGWTPDEAAALRVADQLLETDTLDDAAWHVAADRFDTHQLLELVFLAGYYRMLAGFLRSAQLAVEETIPVPPQAAGQDWI